MITKKEWGYGYDKSRVRKTVAGAAGNHRKAKKQSKKSERESKGKLGYSFLQTSEGNKKTYNR